MSSIINENRFIEMLTRHQPASAASGRNFAGRINELAVFNRALKDNEIGKF